MLKFLKWKNITEFLNNDYPENLWTIKKLPKKHKQKIQDKRYLLRKIKKRIENIENYLLNIKNSQPNQNEFTYPDKNLNLKKNFNGGKSKPNYTQNPITCDKSISLAISGANLNSSYKKGGDKKGLRESNKTRHNVHFLFSSDQLKNNMMKKQNQYRAFSYFLIKLKEKKKFSILYGNVSKKFFEKAYKQAVHSRGKINENLLIQFETRLDVLLYRICFCKNIYAAKQHITHNLVSVNGRILNIPSYQVKAGDIISINLAKKNQLVIHLLEHLKTSLLKRRFRFLISYKYLQKFIKNSAPLNLYKATNKLKIRLTSLIKRYSLLKLRRNVRTTNSQADRRHRYSDLYESKDNFYLSKGSSQAKRGRNVRTTNNQADRRLRYSELYGSKGNLYLSKGSSQAKRDRLIKQRANRQQRRFGIQKKFALLEALAKINNLHRSLAAFIESKQNLMSDKNFLKDKINLKLKKSMQCKRSRQNILCAMRISPMKPLHIEVSYKLLTAVVLFSPQKISLPTIINMHFLTRSLNK